MSIEKEIHQSQFRNVYHKATVNLMYTANWHHFEHLRTLKSYNLTLQEYNVLRILRGNGPKPMSINDIIARMLDKMSNASRVVDGLEKKGFLTRVVCSTDRRAVDISITKKGITKVNDLDEVVNNTEKRFHTLSEKEAEQLNILLDKLRSDK